MLSTARSLIDPAALAGFLTIRYGFAVDDCVLIRSFVNDVYRARADSGELLIKVYRAGRLSPAEIDWEARLSRHLADRGISVPPVHAGRDGELVQLADCAEGPRAVTITDFARGDKPRPPFGGELYRRFGVAVAELHEAALDFRSDRPRSAYELGAAISAAMPLLRSGRLGSADGRLVRDAVAILKRARPMITGLEPGIRHGDVTLDNLLLDGERLIIYDLDLAGPGPLVADLTGVGSTPHWPDFLAGYRSVRTFDDDQLRALPTLGLAATLDNLTFHVLDKPAFAGTESLAEGWVDGALAALRASVADSTR
ncbi:phosphotransferase enzyme family protein [Microlunatus speluncae]|uniref:phosphotransferase enzyme family protein n=1 Tax=Microlunatus speluncae TaxID=2594267 RepID=UPI0012667C05|nr:phosphotransferase [Microlunatus speluncae]